MVMHFRDRIYDWIRVTRNTGTPALVFREKDARLVASGFSETMDADRILLKRVTLTGYPYRIHKRMVVVRW